MRSRFALPLFGILGIICGGIVGKLNTAFIINCGENCSDDPLIWALGCLIAFPVIGQLIRRKTKNTPINTALIAIIFSAVTVFPTITLYGYNLHKKYWKLYSKQANTNTEYSQMVISETAIPSLGIAEAERCAISVNAICKENEKLLPALCQSGFVQIPQQHWMAFKRLPKEDLYGLAPDKEYKSFPKHVCPK
jgi:hypothetical protein